MHKFEENVRIRVLRIFLIVFVLAISVTGCGRYIAKNQKADDAISKAIYEKIGKKAYYEGKRTRDENVMVYHYLIRDSKDESLIADIVETVNEELEENNKEKIFFCIYEEVPGGEMPIIILYNYNNKETDDFGCSYLWYMVIKADEYSSYRQASSYPTLKGIEYLEVVENVNKSAEEEGIDWYEVFPDLKGYEVYAGWVNGKYSGEIIYQEMKEDEVSEN